MLGLAAAAMTLDQYGHLFGDRLDEVAERMATARDDAGARLVPEAEAETWRMPVGAGLTRSGPGMGESAPGRIRTCAPASGGRCSIP